MLLCYWAVCSKISKKSAVELHAYAFYYTARQPKSVRARTLAARKIWTPAIFSGENEASRERIRL